MTDDSFLFDGLKVLDVGSWIAGPVAGTMLADRGADVIKVEVPEIGAVIDSMPCYRSPPTPKSITPGPSTHAISDR